MGEQRTKDQSSASQSIVQQVVTSMTSTCFPKSSPKAASKKKPWSLTKRAFVYFTVGLVIYNVSMMVYIFYTLHHAAKGPAGEIMATTDAVKAAFPLHFDFLMAFVNLPFPNLGARSYFERQKPIFQEAARNFKMHPYFAQTDVNMPDGNPVRWPALIHQRVKAFAKMLQEENRDDFKVEKDRCIMHRFLQNNNIPMNTIHGMWHNKEDFKRDMASGKAYENAEDWPLFVKVCHLTQSSSRGTHPLMSKDDIDDDFMKWADEKWDFRANDWDREWKNEGNIITRDITPGFLLQAPFKQPASEWKIDGRMAVGILEVRIEVIFGRAYLMLIDGNRMFLRDGKHEDYSSPWAVLKMPIEDGTRDDWLVDEGHMECAFNLAEKTAKLMGIDCVRLDVFMKMGDPQGCVINENSLSSGMLYWGHDPYMAQMWQEIYLEKEYTVVDTDKPVYEMTAKDYGL